MTAHTQTNVITQRLVISPNKLQKTKGVSYIHQIQGMDIRLGGFHIGSSKSLIQKYNKATLTYMITVQIKVPNMLPNHLFKTESRRPGQNTHHGKVKSADITTLSTFGYFSNYNSLANKHGRNLVCKLCPRMHMLSRLISA